ncbi:hypothetical protein DTO96_102448 [Ephemeroptericola cinctiostellae]|uniref:Tim44-like domain-containing protein n=1 Tax=Ephemeroptericola cinctiostellae TaxID=2268024 RepID=A0A345DEA4_9BURK|nr:TIM44-like domain-containing protein [Ephemeroptericola cinctiostellae]AXF86692.1 hypothetical protein DTO96_102448 [Ephemeroptericola cinctiostellae]
MKSFLKHSLVALSVAAVGLIGMVTDADAARLGGKKSSGMQRSSEQLSTPSFNQGTKTIAPQNSPQAATNAASPVTPSPVQQPSTARKWLGPIAGIAAGLGIAALLSNLGLGDSMASMLSMLLWAALAFIVIRFALNLFKRQKPQTAGAHVTGYPTSQNSTHFKHEQPPSPVSPHVFQAPGSTSSLKQATHVNAEEFLRTAKGFFIRLQAANDKKDMDDLRRFLTPEMYAEAQLQIMERGPEVQTTQVVSLDATLVSLVSEGSHDIGSVRFTGQLKMNDEAVADEVSEIWHFTKWSNHANEWSLAGIQQD